MAILVTGGAGFIGSHLIELLLRQTETTVICLDNFNNYYDPQRKRSNIAHLLEEPRVTLIEGDFCDALLVEEVFAEYGISHVVHLGAYAGVRYSMENPAIYQRANVEGTANLLAAARRHPVERFVLASSSTVYGRGAAVPFCEDAPLGIPSSPYGVSKRAAELLGQMYYDVHGVPWVALRLFSVYGPRLRPDLALSIFTEAIVRGRGIPLFGDGSVRRDFTHVLDVCRGIVSSLTAPGAVGEAINLGSDRPISMSELLKQLETRIGKRARIVRQPANPADLSATHAELSKARRLLGYQPQVSFADGLDEYLAWFLEQASQAREASAVRLLDEAPQSVAGVRLPQARRRK